MSIAEMDMLLHDLLCEVQHINALVIPDGVEVRKEYSVSWSLRRGSTLEAQNAGMSEEVIRAFNQKLIFILVSLGRAIDELVRHKQAIHAWSPSVSGDVASKKSGPADVTALIYIDLGLNQM